MTIRIGTWNIATGRRMKSARSFDYCAEEDAHYFARHIKQLNLDIICIQESHTNDHDSLTSRLSRMIGFSYYLDVPGAPSHVDAAYKLSDAILSKHPFTATGSMLLPYPGFELKFTHTNKVVPPYDRYLVWTQIGDFTVATTHTEPLGAFGLRYEEGIGKQFAAQISDLFIKTLRTPLIFAADFNIDYLGTAMPALLSRFRLKNILPAHTPTKPQGGHPDYILASSEWSLIDSGIVATESDHYACWAEVARTA